MNEDQPWLPGAHSCEERDGGMGVVLLEACSLPLQITSQNPDAPTQQCDAPSSETRVKHELNFQFFWFKYLTSFSYGLF